MDRGTRRSCRRCGDYIPGGGVELCEVCVEEIHRQGRVRRFYTTLFLTIILALGYYYVYYYRLK
jgi:predicted nucleic acid-binding Zn ribbon protein